MPAKESMPTATFAHPGDQQSDAHLQAKQKEIMSEELPSHCSKKQKLSWISDSETDGSADEHNDGQTQANLHPVYADNFAEESVSICWY
jgi:hypothetical protein